MSATAEAPEKKKRSKAPLIILVIVILVAGGFGISKYIYSLHHEDTDDAQIDGDISPVLTRVSGYIDEIRFSENDHVTKGDTLVKLDNSELLIKVAQAQAALKNAETAVTVATANAQSAHANAATATSNIEAAQVHVWKATQDFNRYQNLVKENATTQVMFDGAKAEKENAEAQLSALVKQQSAVALQAKAADDQISAMQSVIAQRQADLDFATLQLHYATIIAPSSGIASRKNIQTGQYVNAGSALFAIVSDSGIYVIANFKETQLDRMKLNQSVIVTADAYPDKEVKGTIYSFAAATGAKFSLLPPDNATGNFVKVVQRVPIKIKLEGDKATLSMLRPGMSVKVSVLLN